MQLKINWEHRRSKHAIERMWLRGLSLKEVEAAIRTGKRVYQHQTGLVRAFYGHFEVVFDEKMYGDIKKVYPVTIKIK